MGDSADVHGFTDEFLRENGDEPRRAISDFLAFAAGSHLVGHNVFFDMRLLGAQARRFGLAVPRFACSDTLELARRFVPGDSFTLPLGGPPLIDLPTQSPCHGRRVDHL